MKWTKSYLISGIIFSITLALLLGFLFCGIKQPFVGYSPMASNWTFWTICFSVVLVAYTFIPKSTWLYNINSFVLLFISVVIVGIGYLLSPTIASNIFSVAFFSVFTGGGPLWVLLVAWIWHLCATMSPLPEDETTYDDDRQKGYKLAKRVLNEPLLVIDYMDKTGKDRQNIDELISNGKIKAYEYKSYLFIDELD